MRRAEDASSERGFTLAALLVILTVLGVVIAYSVIPLWSASAQRDRDLQTIFAMKQYARAVKEFQRKRNVYPVSLEQLKEQNNPRILRALYPNPLSGKHDWLLVPVGTKGPAPTTKPVPGSTLQTVAPPQPVALPGPGGATAFIGVRPPNQGRSFVSFAGRERYEEWFFTVDDLGPTGRNLPPGIGAPGYTNRP
ncbi:MAG TPA: type II secretion system protein [Thermoanaerobaculia bacterium]|nr:type II secretion system protein [Thermoanaerobaculia bacterium]